jgi:hypothetical protein
MGQKQRRTSAEGSAGEDKKPKGGVRLDPDLVTMVNFIIDVEGGSQQSLLSPIVRNVITKKFADAQEKFAEQQQRRR